MLNIELSEMHKGIIYIVMGAILLCYTLGIVSIGLAYIIIPFALYLIVAGCKRADLYKPIKKVLKKVEKDIEQK